MIAASHLAALFTLAALASPAMAQGPVEAQDYKVLGVETSMKLSRTLHFGTVIIQVDSDDPKEVLATASAVAHTIIDRGTLEAVNLLAYAASPRNEYEVAEVTYSPDPAFMRWNGWNHQMRGAQDEAWSAAAEGFSPSDVVIPATFPYPAAAMVEMCDNLRKCSEGQTDLQMPR